VTGDRQRKAGPAATGVSDRLTPDLVGQARDLVSAAGNRALSALSGWAGDATERLTEYAERGGGPGLAAVVTGVEQVASGKSPTSAALHAGVAGVKERIGRALGGKAGRGRKNKLKVTNIVETLDVGVPARVAYNQWTQFEDFPSFTKKVEHVERTSDDKLTWKAQIFWSHRTWESSIVEQTPDRRIVWRSQGEKGSVDGSVTFHELAPELTRILLVLEYHPQGLFERTGNLWRAQGRRARLELKHFARHVATQTALHPDEVEGWRGEIHDGQVVRGHEPEAPPERRPRAAQERRGREQGDQRDERRGGPRRGSERAGGVPPGSGAARRSNRPDPPEPREGSTRERPRARGQAPTRRTATPNDRDQGLDQ
jgi:uncharacterized membrane protein